MPWHSKYEILTKMSKSLLSYTISASYIYSATLNITRELENSGIVIQNWYFYHIWGCTMYLTINLSVFIFLCGSITKQLIFSYNLTSSALNAIIHIFGNMYEVSVMTNVFLIAHSLTWVSRSRFQLNASIYLISSEHELN